MAHDTPHAALIERITAYCAERRISETTFGRLAVNDWGLVQRLRAGGDITMRTLAKIEAQLAQEPSAPASKSNDAAA